MVIVRLLHVGRRLLSSMINQATRERTAMAAPFQGPGYAERLARRTASLSNLRQQARTPL